MRTDEPSPAPIASATVALPDAGATHALAERLAGALRAGMVIWLTGELGAGKTTLVRGMLRSLGHTGGVRSPTFTLLEPYNLPRFPVYHFDFYRFSSTHEWRDAGFDEYFRGEGACLVEWPQLAGPDLPRPDLRVHLEIRAGEGPLADQGCDGSDAPRRALLEAYDEAGRRCLNAATGGGAC
jgi:tRNA threonylcarbamoyladenosine biosynthesis protein TsaE